MEGGVGSRQSRASSRYASSPSPAVFNGPVRKWKKQWVTTSGSPSIPINNNNRNDAAPPLLLCRWTPLSATASPDQPPTRRFRYAPVVPIEKGNTKAVINEGRTSIRNQSNNGGTHMRSDSDGMLGKPTTGDIPQEEAEELSEDQADSNKSEGHGYSSEKKRKVSPIWES